MIKGIKTFFAGSTCNDLVACQDMGPALIISGHFDKRLRIWDTRTGDSPQKEIELQDRITSVFLSSGIPYCAFFKSNVVLYMYFSHVFHARYHRNLHKLNLWTIKPSIVYKYSFSIIQFLIFFLLILLGSLLIQLGALFF